MECNEGSKVIEFQTKNGKPSIIGKQRLGQMIAQWEREL